MKARYEYFSSLNPYKMEIMQEEEGGRLKRRRRKE
jgi:hypothetical protein